MNPVHQTILHDPENGQYGDCFRACIASLLEKEIKEVPHFMDGLDNDQGTIAIVRLTEWLKPMGLSFINFWSAYDEESLHEWYDFMLKTNEDTYHIISGKSARGFYHAVVGKAGQIIFDPHPSGVGLLQPTEEAPWLYEFIIKIL